MPPDRTCQHGELLTYAERGWAVVARKPRKDKQSRHPCSSAEPLSAAVWGQTVCCGLETESERAREQVAERERERERVPLPGEEVELSEQGGREERRLSVFDWEWGADVDFDTRVRATAAGERAWGTEGAGRAGETDMASTTEERGNGWTEETLSRERSRDSIWETSSTCCCSPVAHTRIRIRGGSLLPDTSYCYNYLTSVLDYAPLAPNGALISLGGKHKSCGRCGRTTGTNAISTLTCTRSCAVQVSVCVPVCVYMLIVKPYSDGSCCLHAVSGQRGSCRHVFHWVFEQFLFVHVPLTTVILKVVSINHCGSQGKRWDMVWVCDLLCLERVCTA